MMNRYECECERGGDCTKITMCAVQLIVEQLQQQVEHYQMHESMIVAACAQAHEYFDGNVSATSLDKFREMLQTAIKGDDDGHN